MVNPLFIIGGIAVAGWAFKQGGDALDNASTLTKWGVAAGGLYVSYAALKSAGVLK